MMLRVMARKGQVLNTNRIDGLKLKIIRIRLGLKQQEVAYLAGMTNSRLCGIELERFRPTDEQLNEICRILRVQPKEIMRAA